VHRVSVPKLGQTSETVETISIASRVPGTAFQGTGVCLLKATCLNGCRVLPYVSLWTSYDFLEEHPPIPLKYSGMLSAIYDLLMLLTSNKPTFLVLLKLDILMFAQETARP
jgi:hypothetical protein